MPTRGPLHYCFFSLGTWEFNASLVRLRHLGAELLQRGWSVTYLVDDLPFNRQSLKWPPGAKVQWVSPAQGRGQFAARRAALRRIGADYVHVLNPSPKSWLALRGLPGQKFVADWDEWHAQGPFPWHRRLRQALFDRWHRRRARLLVVASQYMRDQFQARFGVSPLYLPYATYLDGSPARPSPFTEPTAVYMGSLWPGYDVDLIFDALALLKERGAQARTEILGYGPQFEQWRQFLDQKGLDRVTLAGHVTGEELWARLRHAQVLLFPIRPTSKNLSRCPSKTYAYAQARRPIITCRLGEVAAALGDKAHYVQPTPAAFAEAIHAAMASPQPDVDYQIEPHNWSARAEALLAALAAVDGVTLQPAIPGAVGTGHAES
jgi:glycosyltransferase involved in cell wall biosynthesis